MYKSRCLNEMFRRHNMAEIQMPPSWSHRMIRATQKKIFARKCNSFENSFTFFYTYNAYVLPLMFFLWKIFALKKINLKTFSRPWSSLHTSKEIVFFTAFNVQTHLLIKCLKAHERARTFPLLVLRIPLCTRLVLAITVIYLLFIFSSLR